VTSGWGTVGCVAGAAAWQTAVQGGTWSQILRAGAIAGASAWAFGSIGGAGWSDAATYGAYGAVGGITSVLQGGSFGSGFISAGLSAYAGAKLGPMVAGALDVSERTGAIIAGAAIGGTSSEATGGKFVNGAITGAFAAAVGYDRAQAKMNSRGGQNAPKSNSKFGTTYSDQTAGQVGPLKYQYGSYRQDTLRGATLYMLYGDRTDLKWIQTFTEVIDGHSGVQTLDISKYFDPHGTTLFYPQQPNVRAGGFYDNPGRPYPSEWRAETSVLAPNSKGGYSPIATYSWGFSIGSNGAVSVTPPRVAMPSDFHQNMLRRAE